MNVKTRQKFVGLRLYEWLLLFVVVYCFARVKLAVNRTTQEAVAVKILHLDKSPGAADAVRKEVSWCSKSDFNSVFCLHGVSLSTPLHLGCTKKKKKKKKRRKKKKNHLPLPPLHLTLILGSPLPMRYDHKIKILFNLDNS